MKRRDRNFFMAGVARIIFNNDKFDHRIPFWVSNSLHQLKSFMISKLNITSSSVYDRNLLNTLFYMRVLMNNRGVHNEFFGDKSYIHLFDKDVIKFFNKHVLVFKDSTDDIGTVRRLYNLLDVDGKGNVTLYMNAYTLNEDEVYRTYVCTDPAIDNRELYNIRKTLKAIQLKRSDEDNLERYNSINDDLEIQLELARNFIKDNKENEELRNITIGQYKIEEVNEFVE